MKLNACRVPGTMLRSMRKQEGVGWKCCEQIIWNTDFTHATLMLHRHTKSCRSTGQGGVCEKGGIYDFLYPKDSFMCQLIKIEVPGGGNLESAGVFREELTVQLTLLCRMRVCVCVCVCVCRRYLRKGR